MELQCFPITIAVEPPEQLEVVYEVSFPWRFIFSFDSKTRAERDLAVVSMYIL